MVDVLTWFPSIPFTDDLASINAQIAATNDVTFDLRNAIQLAAGASAVDDYYNDYEITVTRVNTTTGKKTVQRKLIVDYDGTDKLAAIEGQWDTDFLPDTADTYEITQKYTDSRVSINPAIQTLDYITSPRYGRGLSVTDDLKMNTWLATARKCDGQSNVTVKVTASTPVVGDVYKFTDLDSTSGNILFEGTVDSIVGTLPDLYVTFTICLGKLTNKWNNWKTYVIGDMVYNKLQLYRVTTGGIKTTEPVHSSGTTDGLIHVASLTLQQVSGTGAATLTCTAEGNPVRDVDVAGKVISGYSLYDSDGIDYWRYIGWGQKTQRWATAHQVNISLDTARPLFENVNTMLEHFGGIMTYSEGKYELDIEELAGSISPVDSNAAYINEEDHIIGNIRLDDKGTRSSYNSLTVAFPDPGNKFETLNISFFNSDFLKQDRNVPKKGSMTVSGVTNYYNTRLLAEKFLARSRYGLSLSFSMPPRADLLKAGEVVALAHDRYGWTGKKFRIKTIKRKEDCSSDLVVEEYDDSLHSASNVGRIPATGLSGYSQTVSIAAPTNLTATSIANLDELVGGIQITWQNNAAIGNNKNVFTELYSSYSSNRTLNVTDITGTDTLQTTENPTELQIGELIKANTTDNGVVEDTYYYIIAKPAADTFQISLSKGGASVTLTNGSGLTIGFTTTTLAITVPYPGNTYLDTFPGITAQVTKNYWARHRVTKS